MNIRSWAKKWLVREPLLAPVWRNMGYRPGPALLNQEAYKKVGYVYRCIRVLMDNAQQVPVFAATVNRSTGQAVRLPSLHPLSQLLESPNYEDDSKAILESLIQNLNLHGEAIIELESRNSGSSTPGQFLPIDKLPPPTRLWSHPAQWISKVDVDDAGRYSAFHMRARGYDRIIHGQDAAFFKFLHPDDPWRGLAPLSACYQAADTYYAANLFNAKFFENGALPSLHIGFDKDAPIERLGQDQRERIREEIRRLHSGMDNQHGVIVTGPGETVKELGSGLKDMYFEALMKFAMAEILAVFGVPQILMGNVENSNRANSADQLRMFWTDTMIPQIEDVASLFNRKVSRRFGPDIITVFDYSKVAALQKGMKDIIDAAIPAVTEGLLTINEVRTLQLNMGPVPWGDQWWRSDLLLPTSEEGVEAATTPTADDNNEPTTQQQSVQPLTRQEARRLVKEWKNAAICRIRNSGARTPIAAFPAGREAQKAMSRYGIPKQAAWELARMAYTELAMTWNEDNPQDSIAEVFDRHVEAISGNGNGKSL